MITDRKTTSKFCLYKPTKYLLTLSSNGKNSIYIYFPHPNLYAWFATRVSSNTSSVNCQTIIFNNQTMSPSFLRADSQRGAAELTIVRSKRGRVVSLFQYKSTVVSLHKNKIKMSSNAQKRTFYSVESGSNVMRDVL